MAIGNTDLGITLGARVDTSQAQKDINAFTRADKNNKTRTLVLNADINLNKINEKLEKAINTSGWTKKVEADMEKISTSIQRGLSRTLDDGTIVRDLTKVTETFKNEFGKIQERVTIFKDSAMRPLASSLQTVKEGVKEISTSTNTVVKDIDGVTTKVTTLEKIIADTSGTQHTIIQTTKEWVDEQNRLHQEISTTNEKGEQLSSTQNSITNDTNKVTKALKEMGNALNGINKLPTDQRTSKITYVDKNGVKTVKEMINGVDTLITKTKEYTTVQGALVKETKVFNKITGETKTNVEVLRDRQQEEIQKAKELEEQLKKEAQAHRDLLNEKEKALNQLFEEKKQKEIQKSKELEAQLKKEVEAHRNNLNEKEKILQQINQEIQKKNELKQAQEKLNKALVQNVTTQTSGKTTQWGDTSGKQYNALITTIRQVDKEGKVTIKTIEEFTNAQGRLVQQTRVTDENLKKLAADEQVVSTESRTLGQALSDAISRLTKYYVASLPIQAFRKGITEAVTTVKEFDAAITEMGKVTNYSGQQLRNYTEDLGELGREVARTRTEMTEATTGWLKAGYSEEDAAKLAKYSALLQNTADEELSAAEATSILVSQLKAYHMEADEAVKVTDIINAVSAEQAVSSYDISQGLTVASAAMATFGNSIEETTALLTAGTTVFQGRATQVARGLNMIATRIAKNEDALKAYDVEIYNSEGALKSTYEILTELSPAWEQMSNAERVALGNTLAG